MALLTCAPPRPPNISAKTAEASSTLLTDRSRSPGLFLIARTLCTPLCDEVIHGRLARDDVRLHPLLHAADAFADGPEAELAILDPQHDRFALYDAQRAPHLGGYDRSPAGPDPSACLERSVSG